MSFSPQKLVIGISSRALFDMDDSHSIFKKEGLKSYREFQIDNEHIPLKKGQAFELVHKLLRLNDLVLEGPGVEVILLSKNSADTGLRVFNSIEHYKLDIKRAAFTGGQTPYKYALPFQCHLFLSADSNDVKKALESGLAAATIIKSQNNADSDDQLRFAFDGDAVIFSDESEKIYKESGLMAFTENEVVSANVPLAGGPFKPFLGALNQLQKDLVHLDESPIRTALVTARSAPAHERVVKTLREWDIRIDESLFLGGLTKGDFLKAYQADVFFDDQTVHCDSAKEYVTTAHVPHGVANP